MWLALLRVPQGKRRRQATTKLSYQAIQAIQALEALEVAGSRTGYRRPVGVDRIDLDCLKTIKM
jgi:hypothetical protein